MNLQKKKTKIFMVLKLGHKETLEIRLIKLWLRFCGAGPAAIRQDRFLNCDYNATFMT
jgi:hypothetical protein